MSAGNWASSVPDHLVAEGQMGVALGEEVAYARTALERAVAQACAADPWLTRHPVQVQSWGGQFAPCQVPKTADITRAVSDAHAAIYGSRPAVHGVPYGSDQRLLTGLGAVPTVIYGPGDVRHAHAPDESVPVHELVQVTRTLIQLIANTCGTRQTHSADAHHQHRLCGPA